MLTTAGAGLPAATAAMLDRFAALSVETAPDMGPVLDDAVACVGSWTAMHAFEPEANSLYEHVGFRVLETTLKVSPEGFTGLMRLFTEPKPLNDWVRYAGDFELGRFLDIRGMESASSVGRAVDLFLAGVSRCRELLGFAPVGEGLHALGEDFVRESFHEALMDPETGGVVQRALRDCARRPFSLLTTDRLLHLLLGADFFFKVREISEFPWDSLTLSDPSAFVPGGGLRAAMQSLDQDPFFPSSMELEFGRRLAAGRVHIRHVGGVEMESYARERMGCAVRTDNIRALRRKATAEGQADEILILESEGDEGAELHEFVHNIQEEREKGGVAWIAANLTAAEMEAHAWELRLRRRMGDSHLYNAIGALSPFGFAMGLRHYVEQLYVRHAEVPAVVS